MSGLKFNLGNLSGNSEEMQKQLQEKLGCVHQVPFDELFPPEFMKEHTQFASVADFLEGCGNPNEPTEQLKQRVQTGSNFSSWKEMMDAASALYARKQIGLK